MRTAISVPDEVFNSAESLAKRLGISRSELYSTAVAEYLARFEATAVTARLNDFHDEESRGLPAELRRAQARSVGSSEW